MRKCFFLFVFSVMAYPMLGQSIARQWNEEVLHAIRNDFARPTVHARNLFHTSVAMYDAWAVFDNNASPYFLGNTIQGFTSNFTGFIPNGAMQDERKKAISYAVYRIITHRFQNSPNKQAIYEQIETLMEDLGYDSSFTSTDYSRGNGAALGNYIAAQLIAFGLQDGSNEANDYANSVYEPRNLPLNMDLAGNETLTDPNHWQPLRLSNYVDQSGNTVPGGQPPFLSPEWGAVYPFAMSDDTKTTYTVGNFDYHCYYDPGPPVYIKEGLGIDDPYKWNFAMVSVWASHLDPADHTMIDISPASLGNLDSALFPEDFNGYKEFYDFTNGGDPSSGHDLNPATGLPYEAQWVLRGDYTRVLAEFWADGPDSETPPGHWFTLLNYVNDHPDLEKKFAGIGPELSALEWDVKGYFILGGAMHDAAISAWGIKGYYDYIRPVSAIRYLSDQGQSTDPSAPRYHPHGIPLIDDYIELVREGDPLAGEFNENLNKIKLYTWRGPGEIVDPLTDIAGVGWILAEEWFPYQRPSFVTPPFAGYVSGHSTYSRTAAEVLTRFTGDAFFPGGMGVFDMEAGEFLVFEDGPSETLQLQWATYRDASDQCSLSRIWGGIHPPIDDIPGRKIGIQLGQDVFEFASTYFTASLASEGIVFPNPVTADLTILYNANEAVTKIVLYDVRGRQLMETEANLKDESSVTVDVSMIRSGLYFVQLRTAKDEPIFTKKIIKR